MGYILQFEYILAAHILILFLIYDFLNETMVFQKIAQISLKN